MLVVLFLSSLICNVEGFHKATHTQLSVRQTLPIHAERGTGARKTFPSKTVAGNKQARRNYEILETLEVGVQLLGTEVKAVRLGAMNLQDGYAQVKDGECWLKNVHIGPHPTTGSYFQHEAKRERRLLLHKKEIRKFEQAVSLKQVQNRT